MLLRFRAANYRSLRDECELSLLGTEFNEQSARPTGVKVEGREISVVPAAAIFGANASGKSNVLAAIGAMCEGVRASVAEWAQHKGVPREAFALDAACREESTLFELDMVIGQQSIRYTYGFEVSDERVEAEWLHAYPHGRKQVWFDREADRVDGAEFQFPGEGLRGGNQRLVEFTRPNALFLTVGASFNHAKLSVVHRWIMSNFARIAPGDDLTLRSGHTRALLTDPWVDPDLKRQVEALLQAADLGIAGVRVDETLPAGQRVSLLHHTASGDLVSLDFGRQESLGTHAWFGFLGPVLDALRQGTVLLIDELDASLHPVLAAEIVRLFQDKQANRFGAQLIFTSHDATLLGNSVVGRPLDRDQIWITTKRRTGETELYSLIDARPRKEENLERGYLHGRYGGVPRVAAGSVSAAAAGLWSEAV